MNLHEKAYRNGKYAYALSAKRVGEALVNWADKGAILRLYIHCQYKNLTTRNKWQVDHKIPLNSKFVCGLHTENNLRVVTRATNKEKSNQFYPYIEKNGKKEYIGKPVRKRKTNPKTKQKLAKKIVFRKRV